MASGGDGKMFSSNKERAVCSSCNNMPLMWTFAFNGAEWWCPYCGASLPMMNAERIKDTPELKAKHDIYEKHSEDYLDAVCTRNCRSMEIDGERVEQEDIPKELLEEKATIEKEYKFNLSVEEIIASTTTSPLFKKDN